MAFFQTAPKRYSSKLHREAPVLESRFIAFLRVSDFFKEDFDTDVFL